MKQYYAQHAKTITQPGKRDEFIRLLNENVAKVLEHTPGCIYYLVSTTDEPDVVWVSELWSSKDAKDALAANPETAMAMQQLIPLMVSTTDRNTMTVVGGFGLE